MHNIIGLLHEHAKNFPERLAFPSMTYLEFAETISSLAAHLKTLGIEKGDRVMIFAPLSIELYVNMFAVQQLGAIAVFLDSWARRDQLAICAEAVEAKAMISVEQAFHFGPNTPLKIAIGTPVNKAVCPIEPVDPNDTALITFTTGSSGAPKGANRTHSFLAAQHRALDQVIPYLGNETDLPAFPIFALNNLASGITTILPAINLAAPSEQDGEILVSQILEHQIDCCTLSPSLFAKVAAVEKELPSLRRVVTGGAPVSRDDVARFKQIAPNAKIMVLYGSTEVEPIAHIEADEMLASPQREGVNVGKISKDLEYKFIKITKENVETIEEVPLGELIVSGPHVCTDYYKNPEAFKKAKICEQGKVWHRTGDVGSLDEEGNLWLVGRVINTITRNGELLFPVQAEILLKQLPFVEQAAFLGIDNKTYAVVSINAIKDLLTQHGIPVDEVRIVDKIPMDPRHHSKVEYAKLAEML